MLQKGIGMSLKAIDFFCGAGGMSYGLRQAGINVLGGVDIDSECENTYTLSNPGSSYLKKDVSHLHPRELAEHFNIHKHDNSLILVGCSPCQYWSNVNTDRYNSSKTKNLLQDFERLAEYFLPGYIVVENVPGLQTKASNLVLLDFLDFLNLNGYYFKGKVINANHFGVPQNRKRYVLIASRINNESIFPVEVFAPTLTVENFIGTKNGFNRISDGVSDTSEFLHTSAKLSDLNRRRIRATPHNGGTRMAWCNDSELQLKAYIGKDNIFKNVYGRMVWNKPASTITTRFNSLSNGRFGHPEEDRALSLREGATLQTFPKDYIFKGSQASIAKQIGNAVPPELARRIGEALITNWNTCQQLSEQKQEQSIF